MTLKNLIKRYTLKKDAKNLSRSEEKKFNEFIDSLTLSKNKRYIFRGTDKLSQILNTSHIKTFNERLFIVGEKANFFTDIKDSENVINYSNVDSETFKIIFTRLHDLLTWEDKSKKPKEVHYQKQLDTFKKKEPDFVEYFSNINKELEFCKSVEKLNYNTKVIVADYYLALLHTCGKRGYHSESYFLSTAERQKIAEKFKGRDGKIIIGWIPKSSSKNMIKYELSDTNQTNFKKNKLPLYSARVFPEQAEISLKCGLLPHYIIGYIKDTNFEINPHILNITKYDNIIDEGIPIDQKDFKTFLERTNYRTFYILIDGNIYI